MKESYQESMRKVVSAEYKEISDALIKVNASLDNINSHLGDLNGKTTIHSKCIASIEKWISAHDAVRDVLEQLENNKRQSKFERIKNNIALAGLMIVVIIQVIQMI